MVFWSRQLLFFAFVHGSSAIFAQQLIKGKILDSRDDSPIPFVHVRISETVIGTSSNLDGQFELKVPNNTPEKQGITFSSIGYKSKKVDIPEDDSPVIVHLEASMTQLSGVTITGNKDKNKTTNQARRIVRKAFRRVKKNYSNAPMRYPSFYRHYCAENGHYVRLIEAALDLYRNGKEPYTAIIPEENLKFQVNQLRRSFDFTENSRLSHPPISLNFLLSNDITAYTYHNPWKNGQSFKYTLTDTTSYEGDAVFVVDFQTSGEGSFESHYHGKLFIHSQDFAFIRTEITESNTLSSIGDSTVIEIKKIVLYKQSENQYFLHRLSTDLSALHVAFDSLGNISDSVVHDAHIELIANNLILDPINRTGSTEPKAEDLVNVPYDSTFWDNYNILQATDLENRIIADLSERLSLRKQFELFNTVEEGGKSIIESQAFQEMLSKYSEIPTYVVVWSSEGVPNYFDIEPTPYFFKKIKKEKARLLLVSIDPEEDWKMAREIYQLNKKGILHDRISFGFDSDLVNSLFNTILPFYCFFDQDLNLENEKPPLPASVEVDAFLKSNHSAKTSGSAGRSNPPIK